MEQSITVLYDDNANSDSFYDELMRRWALYDSDLYNDLMVKMPHVHPINEIRQDFINRLQFAAHAEEIYPGLLDWLYNRIKILLSDVGLKTPI